MSSSNHKIRGAIFRADLGECTARYYLAEFKGLTADRKCAHVYAIHDLKELVLSANHWGGKHTGTWELVYE